MIFGYLASILMGLSLGMIGGGGSILTVPILVYLFAIPPVLATAYSLFIVGLTALVGGLSYLRKGEVDVKIGFIFAVPSFVGVYLTRAYVMPSLPDPVFSVGTLLVSKPLLIMLVFSVMMLAASISMIRGGKKDSSAKDQSTKTPTAKTQSTPWLLIGAEGLIVGGVTGFVGAGGGFLIIPALVVLVGLSMKRAVGTSLMIIAAKSLLGFTGDLQTGTQMDWTLLISISAIALIGLFVGMNLVKKVPEQVLKKAFGYFVLVMGSFILFDQLIRIL